MDLNWDKYGVLLTNEGSDGDSAHHTIYFHIMNDIANNANSYAEERIKPFYDALGMFRRHPVRPTNDFSRDQFTPFLAYNALRGNSLYHVNKYYSLVRKNWGFFFNSHQSGGEIKEWWNRDWMDPATRGLFLRGKEKKSLKLYFTDFHLLTSVIFRIIKVRKDPSSTADENLQLHLLIAKLRHSTCVSNFAAKIYFKYRPDNNGGKSWEGAVLDFWSRGGTYVPGMVPVTIAAIKKSFGL